MTSGQQEIIASLKAAGCGIRRAFARPPVTVQQPVVRPRTYITPLGTGPALGHILAAVSVRTGFSTRDIIGRRRHQDVVRARMIYWALARRLTKCSTTKLGDYSGGRDHSTVMHGTQKVERNPAAFEPEMSELLAALKRGGV